MLLENLAVNHGRFGAGTITKINGKYIVVRFDGVEKTFVYPDAFEKFLTLSDGTVPAEILDDLHAARAEREMIQNAKDEENALAMTRGIVIPGKDINTELKDEDGTQSETEEI